MRILKRALCVLLAVCLSLGVCYHVEAAKKTKNSNEKKQIEKVKNISCDKYGVDFITLSWDKVDRAEGYEIYRSTKVKNVYVQVATIKKGKRTTWTDNNLKKNTKYFYKIRAYGNKKNERIYSAFSKVYKKKTAKTELESIKQYTYVPYRSGGFTTAGWDCSGFTKWALKEYYGVDIPKGAAAQGYSGKKISLSNRKKWKPGDVLIYQDGGQIGHVALYLGDNKLMHALNSRLGTIIQDVDYYERWDGGTRLIGVRRFAKNKKK